MGDGEQAGTLEYLPLALPEGFDPDKHASALPKAIAAKHGEGWRIESIDMSKRVATLVRAQAAVMRRDGLRISLPAGTRPSDGERIAQRQAELNPGYQLVRFEPHLGVAYLAQMNADELRCREAVSTALRCKPWDVTCRQRADGGYTLRLPGIYQPGRADDALANVAENVVGKYGWYVTVNPMTLQCEIIPSDPPTFPEFCRFDFGATPKGAIDDATRFALPLGMTLAAPGQRNTPMSMDLSDSVGALIVGLAGSGKSTAVQSIIYNALARGFRLALIDSVDKKTDLEWAKPYVEPHMWGCETVAEAVVVAKLVNEEGARLGELLAKHGVSKWQDLPKDVKSKRENAPLLVVADELAALLTADPMPPGLPKEVKSLPEFVKMQQDLLEAKLLSTTLSQGPAVYRAAGIRYAYLTQQPNERYGFSTKLKGNLPHRFMLGVSPSSAEKAHAFRTPEKIPDVPAHIATNHKAARGVGLVHLDGHQPAVFKGFWAPLEDYVEAIRQLGAPTTSEPRPTAEQIARLVPRIDAFADDLPDDDGGLTVGEWTPSRKSPAQISKETGIGPVAAYGDDGKRLSGAAAAARASKHELATAECPSCEQPIRADGTCGCSW